MPLSSNTLFHFTNKLDVLYKILEEGFWPRYCKETGWKKEGNPLFAVALVSFCDIPLSQIHQHINYYGNYGIGVSKEWAMNKSVQPIFYITKKTLPFFDKIASKGLANIQRNMKEKNDYNTITKLILSRSKPYSGWNWKEKENNNQIIRNYIYYNEREWRYVPDELKENSCIIVRDKNIDLEEWNKKTTVYRIKPDLKDIKYILIKSETERKEALDNIDKLFGDNQTAHEIALLKSKILTCEQIKEDF